MIKLTIINESPETGKTAVVQVDGFVEETLPPGQQTTVFVDRENDCVISEQED